MNAILIKTLGGEQERVVAGKSPAARSARVLEDGERLGREGIVVWREKASSKSKGRTEGEAVGRGRKEEKGRRMEGKRMIFVLGAIL